MKKISIQLEELICPMCPKKIEDALKKENGVETASVSFNSAKCKVSFDENLIGSARIEEIITKLGYEIIK